MTALSRIRRLFASRRPRTILKAPARRRPAVEALEGRLVPATLTVFRLADDAAVGSLRWAITQANTAPSDDTIDFSVTGTINLTGALPSLDSNLAVQGPGAHLLTVRRNAGGNYGIFNVPGGRTVTLSGLTIANGGGSGDFGGGITNGGTLTVSNCTLSGNSTANFGGGIRNQGLLTVRNSTLSGNAANAGGGIANVFSGTVTVSNSTLSGNSSFGSGGGIDNTTGTLTVVNSTVTGNSTEVLGGGISAGRGMTLHNSLVVNNTGRDYFGDSLTGSHYLFGTMALGPLQLNGGPTPTHALPAGSPALNAGSNALIPAGVTTDQRGPGFARVFGGTVDIGAFEVHSGTPTIARNQAAVTANEATQAANTGTFDDPDGRGTVTLTASLGTVTQNTAAGTWSWSYTPPDGPAATTVAVTATDNTGQHVTTTFSLSATNVAPTITAVAVPAGGAAGSPVTLSAAAADPAGAADPLTFTWTITRPDQSIFTVTGASASFTPAATGRHGVSLSVSDGDGGVASHVAAPAGLVSWWRAEGTAGDARGSNHGTLVGGVTFAPGRVGQAFNFNGSNRVQVPDAPNLDLTSAVTLEAWVNPSSLSFSGGHGAVLAKSMPGNIRNYGLYVRTDGSLSLSYYTTGAVNVVLNTAANVVPVGQFSHVAAVIHPGSNVMQVYRNGQLLASRTTAGPLLANAAPLTLGMSDNTFGFRGLIDEPTVYGRALGQPEIQAIVSAGAAGKAAELPVDPGAGNFLHLTGLPAGVTAGAPATLTVTARDRFGSGLGGYRGTVRFTSSDPVAGLPANYTFTAADNGVKTFSVTLYVAGNQTVTVTDTVTATITGTVPTGVRPGPVALYYVYPGSELATTVTRNVPTTIYVFPFDQYYNWITTYAGTIAFYTPDPLGAVPANYTFTGSEGGIGVPGAVTFGTLGQQELYVWDYPGVSVFGYAAYTVVPGAGPGAGPGPGAGDAAALLADADQPAEAAAAAPLDRSAAPALDAGYVELLFARPSPAAPQVAVGQLVAGQRPAPVVERWSTPLTDEIFQAV